MNTGDFVEILDTQDGGKITKVLSKNKVEVLLDNGFIMKVETAKLKLGVEPVRKESPRKKHAIAMPSIKEDLHIEQLITDFKGLNNAEKIRIQLDAFENKLSAALAAGMLEITFIHGIGTGVLRKAIHASLKKNKGIKSFAEAQFDRGATLVKIY